MVRQAMEIKTKDIAELLKEKKRLGKRMGLFIGQRMGPFFADNRLYKAIKRKDNLAEILKQDASTNEHFLLLLDSYIDLLASQMSAVQFGACYDMLNRYFKAAGIYTTLMSVIKDVQPREEDALLVKLLKEGIFDPVIMTRIDTQLEDACNVGNMLQSNDYLVISCREDNSDEIKQEQEGLCRIIKVFGDLDNLTYRAVGNIFDLEGDQTLKTFLHSQLAEEVLVLGYDLTWDRPLEQAFLDSGKVLWYVNEELPQPDTHLARALDQRNGKYLVYPPESCSDFLQALYAQIGDARLGTGERKKAFISYSHKDKKYLERLQVHLRGLLHPENEADFDKTDVLDIWDDTRIPVGANWEDEIMQALASTKVAVLLLSADFMNSDFIRKHELPILLAARQANEIQLLSVVIGPCGALEKHPVSHYQLINALSSPLISLTRFKQEQLWTKAAKEIVNVLDLQE